MAKTTAPLLSFDAAGTIAKTQTYARWKGVKYVRRYGTPSNPQTSEQTLTREAFTGISNIYKFAPADMTDIWTAFVRGKPLTPINAFIQANLPDLRTASDLENLVVGRGVLGGLPPAGLGVVPGVGTLTINITPPPALPTGWTIDSGVAIALPDGDIHGYSPFEIVSGTDATDPYSIVLTCNVAAQYSAYGFFKFLRPDGKFAYGPVMQDFGTPT